MNTFNYTLIVKGRPSFFKYVVTAGTKDYAVLIYGFNSITEALDFLDREKVSRYALIVE